MCGINGLMSLGPSLPVGSESLITNMNNALVHRGPDDEGVYVDYAAGIALGHRRLSIIDLSSEGHQPMIDENKNVIVFNGEIYNYNELKNKFKNFNYSTKSDTEVLLKLFSTLGSDALHELNGMFAFAFYDHNKRELFLARDRAGKKPLYYSTLNNIFAFSSEIKALLTLPWINAAADNEALYDFLTFNQLDAPRTMFKGIHKMAPAEWLKISGKGIKEKKYYWQIDYKDLSGKSEPELADKVFEELKKSVQYRMVADVPVGAFLSGGVDSSAVVALMRQHSENVIKTYSVGFADQPSYDERIYAERISKMFNTEHHEKIISANDIREFLPKIVEIFDEPMADATCIPIYFISKLAKENNTIVVQTGDGADELFAGYNGWQKYYNMYPWFHRFTAMPSFVRSAVSSISGFSKSESPVKEIIQRGAKRQEFFWGGAKAFKEHTKKNVLNAEWLSDLEQPDSYQLIKKYRDAFTILQKKHPHLNDLDWMCYLGFKFLIPSKYLYRMDRLGMANSIEIRSPFLDYNMVNTALSIPSNYKVKEGVSKYILKKSLERILPNEVLYRKKMGFNVPLKELAGEIMLEYIEDNMNDFCSNTGIFKKQELKNYIAETRNGNTAFTNNLWTIYFLMAWFKRWM